MKFDKPKGGNGSSVEDDIRKANARMIYENPEAYAEWRIKVGMDKRREGPVNPAMRGRIAAEFRKLGVQLASIPDEKKFKPSLQPYVLPDKAVPIVASDAFRAHNQRRKDEEVDLPW